MLYVKLDVKGVIPIYITNGSGDPMIQWPLDIYPQVGMTLEIDRKLWEIVNIHSFRIDDCPNDTRWVTEVVCKISDACLV